MPNPKLSNEEITQRGQELYKKSIRSQVETTENIGKIISINVETGEYEIGNDLVVTSRRLQSRQADAAIWSERIGFNAVYAVGGTWNSVDQEIAVLGMGGRPLVGTNR